MLKYNTLYQSLKKVSAEWHAGHVQWEYVWSYLKFYEDATVIYCSSSNNTNNLKWFSKENKEAFFYKGTYIINAHKIEINIPATIGNLNFDGEINANSLVLRLNNTSTNLKEFWDLYSIPDMLIQSF
jgi:hypothetical protein